MQIQEISKLIHVSPRKLRHYEAAGLLEPRRNDSGYRIYNESDLRRAIRIRDLIAAGFSTREIHAMSPCCLSDEGAGVCEEEGLASLQYKREQIDALMIELKNKRELITARMNDLRATLNFDIDYKIK